MSGIEKRKQSLYFPDEMLKEIMIEANRLDRSLSWVVQRAWAIAAREVARLPSAQRTASPTRSASEVAASRQQPLPAAPPAPPPEPEREPGSQVLDFIRGKFENGTR